MSQHFCYPVSALGASTAVSAAGASADSTSTDHLRRPPPSACRLTTSNIRGKAANYTIDRKNKIRHADRYIIDTVQIANVYADSLQLREADIRAGQASGRGEREKRASEHQERRPAIDRPPVKISAAERPDGLASAQRHRNATADRGPSTLAFTRALTRLHAPRTMD